MNIPRVTRPRLTVVCLAGGSAALLGDYPRDFVRIVITRPDTVGAHVGSLATWLEFLGRSQPMHFGALLLSIVTLAGIWTLGIPDWKQATKGPATGPAIADGSGDTQGTEAEK